MQLMEMKKIGIFFGSSTGNTEAIAYKLQHLFGNDSADTHNVETAEQHDLERYPFLIFGTSTWGIGELQDDWESFLDIVDKVDLAQKKVALFGLGDQEIYPESFADAVGKLYERIEGKTTVVGQWPNEGYAFDESVAFKDNKFVGLILDVDNQATLNDGRLSGWVELLKKEFGID